MGSRTVRAAIAAAAVMTVFTACDPGPGKTAKPTVDTTSGSPTASATPVRNYTAAQLKKALIKPPAGAMATRMGSGSYDKVLAKFSGHDAPKLTDDHSSCGSLSRTDLKQLATTPSAFVSFAQVERSSSVLLVAIPGSEAKQAAAEPVPAACRTSKAKVGGTTVTAKVVSDEAFGIGGDGGRIVRTDETSGGVRLRLWDITLAGPGYLAMTEVVGESVTRADVERLARQVHSKASSTLK